MQTYNIQAKRNKINDTYIQQTKKWEIYVYTTYEQEVHTGKRTESREEKLMNWQIDCCEPLDHVCYCVYFSCSPAFGSVYE